jgi:hypothetical protein
MNKNEEIELISKKVHQELNSNLKNTIKLKLKLIPLIDKLKKNYEINSKIEIYEIIEQLHRDNLNHNGNYIKISKCNNVFFVSLTKFKEDCLDAESIITEHELKENTRVITYSLLSLLLFFLISIINKNYTYIIYPVSFILLYILNINFKNKNITVLLYSIAGFIFIDSQNAFIVGIILLLFMIPKIIDENLKKIIKHIDKKELKDIVLGVLALVFAFCFYLSYAQEYIGIKLYIIAKSMILFILFFTYICKNRFNILHTSLFLVISFSIYNAISNIMKTLHEKNIIFHPYDEKINFDFSLLSIAITIIIFSVPSIIQYLRSFLRYTDISFCLAFTSISSLLFIIFSLFYIFSKENGILKIILTIVLSLALSLLCLSIYFNRNHKKPNIIMKLTAFDKLFFNKNNYEVIKILDYIDLFYKPLQINKDLPFNKNVYLENIAFVFIAIMVIYSFIFNYNHIYHYQYNTDYSICKTKNDNTDNQITDKLMYRPNNSNFVYMLTESPTDREKLLLLKQKTKESFKLKFKGKKTIMHITKEDCQ